jgi:hypothetical protein
MSAEKQSLPVMNVTQVSEAVTRGRYPNRQVRFIREVPIEQPRFTWDATRTAKIYVTFLDCGGVPHFGIPSNNGNLAYPELMRAYGDLLYEAANYVEKLTLELEKEAAAERERLAIVNRDYQI